MAAPAEAQLSHAISWDGPVRRWRLDGLKTLRCVRSLYRPNVRSLPHLHLRHQDRDGPSCVPVQFSLLEFLIKNRSCLEQSPWIIMLYRTLNQTPKEREKTITQAARAFMECLWQMECL